jgi:hypothetical protein
MRVSGIVARFLGRDLGRVFLSDLAVEIGDLLGRPRPPKLPLKLEDTLLETEVAVV